jgi:hypothetical protein
MALRGGQNAVIFLCKIQLHGITGGKSPDDPVKTKETPISPKRDITAALET